MATATSSEVAEGPVMSLISKRLRALRKKLNRISQMEETLAQGKKALNAEQQEVLRSKPTILIAINELEKLRPALSLAVDDEITLATKNKHYERQDQILAEAEPVEDPSCVKITATPETTVDIAAAAGNYSIFEARVETVLLQSEVDSSTVEVLQEGEEAAVCQENGTYDSHSSYVEEAPKDKEENETYDSQPSCDVEQVPKVELEQESKVKGEPTAVNNSQEEEEDSGEFGWKSNVSRKNYNRSGRGGGRRSFPNGRGSGGSSSSRGGGPYYPNNGQNYENGNFYPRSYSNNSKGRGRGRSGNVNNNHGSGAQVAYTAAVES